MGSMSIGSSSATNLTPMTGYTGSISSPVAFLPGGNTFGLQQAAVMSMSPIYSPPHFSQLHQAQFGQFSPTPLSHQAYAQGNLMPYGPRYGGVTQRSPAYGPRYFDDMMPAVSYRGDDFYGRGGRHMTRCGRPTGYRNRNNLQASGQHNHVDVERIQAGIDVRTTVSHLFCEEQYADC